MAHFVVITIVVKNDQIKIKNGKKRRFIPKNKKRKKTGKNDKENNLTLLHLLLHFKIKNLVYTI